MVYVPKGYYEDVQEMLANNRQARLIIDEICRNRFHTLLNIEYVYERNALENLAMEGKVYGSEPTIKVLMEFETIFFGDPPELSPGVEGRDLGTTTCFELALRLAYVL